MKVLFKLLLPILLVSFFVTGCGTVRLTASTNSFHIVKERVPSLKSGQTVKVDNFYAKPKVVTLTGRLDADLQQYTATAMTLLEQGLGHQEISVGPNGKKSIKLQVHNVKYVRGFWSLQVDLNTTVTLGNGKSFTVTHHNSSPASGFRAVSGAIARAVEKILKHNEFIAYINK